MRNCPQSSGANFWADREGCLVDGFLVKVVPHEDVGVDKLEDSDWMRCDVMELALPWPGTCFTAPSQWHLTVPHWLLEGPRFAVAWCERCLKHWQSRS